MAATGFSSRHGRASWPRPSGLKRDAPYVCLPGTGATQYRHRLLEQALLQPYPSMLWCSGASSRAAPRSATTRPADRRHSGPAWARLVRVPGPNRKTMTCEGTGGAGRREARVHRSPLEGSRRIFLCASRFKHQKLGCLCIGTMDFNILSSRSDSDRIKARASLRRLGVWPSGLQYPTCGILASRSRSTVGSSSKSCRTISKPHR